MVSKRGSRNGTQQQQQEEEDGSGVSDYEKMRQKRIKDNKERLEKMGILGLANSLKPPCKPKPKPKPQPRKPPSTQPSRRSSRLTETERVDYSEKSLKNGPYVLIPAPENERRGRVRLPKFKKGRKHSEDEEICIKKSLNPEVYTEDHERLLGDCKKVWILDVDGFDEDGQRIYDQFEGKHCHQCRQKTLRHHTKCSNCKAVEGQFCGDCLFTRYGENVVESNENLSWTCPICRGICNCSRCRRAQGWEPTGDIYWKVKKQGFKSVAHFLIETRMEHKIEDPKIEDMRQAVADGGSKLIDGKPSQSDRNSVLEISSDNTHGGTDEDPKIEDMRQAVADGKPSQSDHNSVLEISGDNTHGGTDEDYDAADSDDSDDSSGDESEDSK